MRIFFTSSFKRERIREGATR